MHIQYRTKGTCSQMIEFDLEDGKVTNVSFFGGCNGNLKAISKLVEGMSAEQIVRTLRGNTCGFRETSCADQLALAVAHAVEKESK